MSNDREAFEKIFGEEPYLARDAINWQHKLAGWQAAQSRHAAEREALVNALKLALEYWQHRQQRYKNRHPVWVEAAREALALLDSGGQG
jgi:hypothetical protein